MTTLPDVYQNQSRDTSPKPYQNLPDNADTSSRIGRSSDNISGVDNAPYTNDSYKI